MCKEMKTINIKGKEYVEVNERIKFFRSEPQFAGYSLTSEIIEMLDGVVTIKAIIKDPNGFIVATGFAQEKENSSFINKTSYVENCETSAWGRALANLGIGIDTSIASSDEVQNAILNQHSITDQDLKNALLDEQLATEEKRFRCADCGKEITANEQDYSMKYFSRGLCRSCQNNAKKLKSA